MSATRSDVLIIGGGLAGLTLAIQLRRELPQLSVRVLERRRHPVPEAAFKVGESTVEIGADYFDRVLGLRAHLDAQQIRKFGFRFFFNHGSDDIARCTELGVRQVLPKASFQLDRGIFENFLGAEARRLGVAFDDGAMVRAVELAAAGGGDEHTVRFEHDGRRATAQARWLIDASGRAGVLKRQLDLAEANAHDAHAIWFRIGERIAIDDWSDDPAWRGRVEPRERWRSTNHLCGPGYWAWLIPLASGSHSIGIVADPAFHPLETMDTFDKALAWFERHQPQLHRALAPHRDKLQDFAFERRFSYGCKQVFSAQRWALSGEAGLFLDPFYSPGSDFIAIGNTLIVGLIARDAAGAAFAREARLWQNLYFSFYRTMLTLYEGQYALFGDTALIPLKVTWDYTFYWGILCPFFFQRRLTDLGLFARLAETMAYCDALNREMQALLRAACRIEPLPREARFFDQCDLPWFVELNRALSDELDAAATEQRVRANALTLERLAAEIVAFVRARGDAPGADMPLLGALAPRTPQLLSAAA